MIDLKELQKEILENKIKNNFPTNDLKHELKLFLGEVEEMKVELDKFFTLNNDNELSKEIADVAIFLISIARMTGVDLEKAITDKIEYNKNRSYKPGTFRIEDPIDKLYENDDDETKRIVESDFFKKDNHSMCLLN